VKPYRPSVRRLLSVLSAVVIGLVGALLFASPASAHYSSVSGTAACVNGNWVVSWTVVTHRQPANSTWALYLVLAQHVVSGQAPVTDPDPITENVFQDSTKNFTGTQTIDGAFKGNAKLSVKAKWSDKYKEYNAQVGTVYLPGGCTTQPNPTATFAAQCNGSVKVMLRNDNGLAPAVFSITGVPGTTTVPAGMKPTDAAVVVTIPAGTGTITVTQGAQNKQVGDAFTWSAPDGCAPVKIDSKMDCAQFSVTLLNPDGPATTYTIVAGGQTQTGTLNVGETKDFGPFPGTPGAMAVVTIGTGIPNNVSWVKPDTCSGSTTAPPLADTGGDVTNLVALAGVFVGGGIGMIGLLFLIRRRRTIAAH
jgi:LPXTG-motif cell wall-anchored protein